MAINYSLLNHYTCTNCYNSFYVKSFQEPRYPHCAYCGDEDNLYLLGTAELAPHSSKFSEGELPKVVSEPIDVVELIQNHSSINYNQTRNKCRNFLSAECPNNCSFSPCSKFIER